MVALLIKTIGGTLNPVKHNARFRFVFTTLFSKNVMVRISPDKMPLCVSTMHTCSLPVLACVYNCHEFKPKINIACQKHVYVCWRIVGHLWGGQEFPWSCKEVCESHIHKELRNLNRKKATGGILWAEDIFMMIPVRVLWFVTRNGWLLVYHYMYPIISALKLYIFQ